LKKNHQIKFNYKVVMVRIESLELLEYPLTTFQLKTFSIKRHGYPFPQEMDNDSVFQQLQTEGYFNPIMFPLLNHGLVVKNLIL
jgi:hypothetical protein